ncbi:hypothetical protein PITC_048650 [Penicillium italicum]|uniref:Zn(2)-C6 fungal-type domain-containing protein n=1 Tax=Penicillium italicum TaxID=40296 RepID=A0A0A2KJ36_PENIT|nr:hypothetical protein PITC_048650 [Penicillium italicum]
MDYQTPMANDADSSRPPSAPLSTTSSAKSSHPLGFPCVECKAKHKRCDRTRPACQSCQSRGREAECTYPSAALPVAENKSANNRITKKTGAPFPGPLLKQASALPTTGDKRPRSADSSYKQTELVNDMVGLPIQNDPNYAQWTEIPQQSPEKRQRISELDSGSTARQSAMARGQITPFGTGTPSGSRLAPPLRSISPTLPQDETELRCNLTTEINVQRMKHRNLTAETLRNIVKLLMKAKNGRPPPEPTTDGSSAMPLSDEWREEDDLMRVATVKLKTGGRCSRALLSRFENFLYGPLMSPEEKKMQERIICVEECLSSASAPPTSDHNYLFLHRLKRIILHADAYGLDERDSRIGFLCNQLLEAIATNSKLTPSNRKKFAELLDPDGEIANVSADSPGVKAEAPISKRKVPPKPTSPRVPSSHTPGTPSRTITRQQTSVTSLSPLPPHPLPLPSRSSSLSTALSEPVDFTDDNMSSSFPFIVKRNPKKRVASGNQSSQSNDTALPSLVPASKKRPAPGGQSDDMAAPSSKRAASGTQSSNLNNIIASAPQPAASGTHLSSSNNMIAPAPMLAASGTQSSNLNNNIASAPQPAASGTQSSNLNNIIASAPQPAASGNQASSSNNMIAPAPMLAASGTQPSYLNNNIASAPQPAASGNQASSSNSVIAPAHLRSASGSQPFSSNVPKKLWNVFLAKEAHLIPVLDLNKLKATFALAVNHGNFEPKGIDPILGLCLAIACHLTRDRGLGESRKWYDAALTRIAPTLNSQASLQSFHQHILQIQYLHMVGHLRMAWETLSQAIGRAQPLRMQTMHGGRLAVDEESLQQVRLVWQCLWMKKLSLALQLGIVDQSLETFCDFPMPMQSQIEINMGSDLSPSNDRDLAASSFFVACTSFYKHTDQLITVENDLRVTRMECPIKWLSILDLRDFQALNRNLSSWKNGLPKFLEWKDSNIDMTLEKDPIIRRMCRVTHIRYTYFQLRQNRPFFILCLRLFRPCTCELAPHVPGKNTNPLNMDPLLSLVYNAAVKCIMFAQDIVKILCASFAQENDDDSMCEQLDYLYTAALVLVASRSSPLSLVQRGEPGGITRSSTVLQSQFRQADTLLRNYEECCDTKPKLRRRIERSRALLDLLDNISVPGSDNSFSLICDNDIRVAPIFWHQLYDRLGLDVPFRRFLGAPASDVTTVAGRRLTFGWMESIPVDLDPQEKQGVESLNRR